MFPELKIPFRDVHFKSLNDIENNVSTVLKRLMEHNFQQYCQVWQRHLNVCIKTEGECCEGDYSYCTHTHTKSVWLVNFQTSCFMGQGFCFWGL